MNLIKKYSRYFKGDSVYGIDIFWISDDDLKINIILLKQKKGIVSIDQRFNDLQSLEEAFEKINNSIPVILNIDGKGVLHKPFAAQPDVNKEKAISELFPNYSTEIFYLQEETAFFSLARHDFVDAIIEQFTAKGYHIYNVGLGPFVINGLKNLITDRKSLIINNYKIQLENGLIRNFIKSEEEMKSVIPIGDENLGKKDILSYASAISFFIKEQLCDFEKVVASREEFYYKNAFRIGFISVVFFFFSILLINFFIYDHYNKGLSKSLINLNNRKELVRQLTKLKKEVATKEAFLNSNKFLETSKLSYYADRLACNLPQKIVLHEMNIFPLKRNMIKKEYAYNSNTIYVSGTTNNTTDLNNWIKLLKNEEWVNKVEMINLSQLQSFDETDFKMEIKIK